MRLMSKFRPSEVNCMKLSISIAVLAVSLSLAGCGSLDMIFQGHYSEYELTETQV